VHDTELDRCAAYVAARAALAAIHDATHEWPTDLASQARRAAIDTVMTTAEGLAYDHGTAARRRCVRNALATAIALAATVDVARALGHADPRLDRAQHHAGRAIALLGLLFQASTMPPD
jgi:hypothetical protein